MMSREEINQHLRRCFYVVRKNWKRPGYTVYNRKKVDEVGYFYTDNMTLSELRKFAANLEQTPEEFVEWQNYLTTI